MGRSLYNISAITELLVGVSLVLTPVFVTGSPAIAEDACWPQWRGPQRDGQAEGFGVVESWPEALELLWQVDVEPGHPSAAVRILNDPIRQADAIREAVAAGYVVRTRADADTREARVGETKRREAAFDGRLRAQLRQGEREASRCALLHVLLRAAAAEAADRDQVRRRRLVPAIGGHELLGGAQLPQALGRLLQ